MSLHIIVGGLLLLAAFSGVVSTFLWMDTGKRWDAHLHRAESVGMQIHWSQENDRPAPAGISIDQISVEDDKLARAGKFSLMSSVSSADLVTQLSLSGVTESGDRSHISLAITSPDLRYPVGRVVSNGQGTKMSLAEKLGQISVLVASYCSDATDYMKYDGRPWVRVRPMPYGPAPPLRWITVCRRVCSWRSR